MNRARSLNKAGSYMSIWSSPLSTGSNVKILVPKHETDQETIKRVLLRWTALGKNTGQRANAIKQTERIARLK